jgi:uncharacterized membrane protein YbhN (UPF0104 family)
MSRSVLIRERPAETYIVRPDGLLAARTPMRQGILLALFAAASLGTIATARLADVDIAGDLWNHLGALSGDAARLRWGLVPVLAALTGLHYLASSLGVRAAADGVSGRRLGLWEITSSQFAGAAANRLAPGGLGSVAVTCRFLTRRGLAGCEATAAVAVVGFARATTKLGLVAGAVIVWSLTVPTGPSVIDLGRLVPRHCPTLVLVLVAAAALAVTVAIAVLFRRRRTLGARLRAAVAGVMRALRHALSRPRCLLSASVSAAGANLALALAFGVSVLAIPGTGDVPLGALPAVYLLGSTVGAAVPTPAGVGSTEAALITVLTAIRVPAAEAAQAVMLFRIMTLWAPIPAGVMSTRRLRRLGGL